MLTCHMSMLSTSCIPEIAQARVGLTLPQRAGEAEISVVREAGTIYNMLKMDVDLLKKQVVYQKSLSH